jgi:predicted small secreted protein
MERASRGHIGDTSANDLQEDPVTTTRTRRWRLAAAGVAIAATSFTTAACGSDTVDDGVEQEVEDAGNEVEEEVEGGDQDGDG